MLPLILVVTLSAASHHQLLTQRSDSSQRPCLLKIQALRGGGTLKPMRIAAKTVDGMLNFDPLLMFDRGDGSLLRRVVAFVAYHVIAHVATWTALFFCAFIVPMFWLLPFTMTMSMFVPVAMTENSGTRLASPAMLLKRCRKLAAGQKLKVFWALMYGRFAAGCIASLAPIAFKILKDAAGSKHALTKTLAEVSPAWVTVVTGLYAWLSIVYVDFLIYDELASHTPEQKESMA